MLISWLLNSWKICGQNSHFTSSTAPTRVLLCKQYINPSAGTRTMYYDCEWKGDLYVTPIEISNGICRRFVRVGL
jgi:hypothetical protein